MPLPLAPIAGIALRYGAVALIGAVVARNHIKKRAEKDAVREASLDGVPDGFDVTRVEGEEDVQIEGSHGHWQRIWLGRRGVEIDSRILGRLRFRKLDRD